MVLRTVCKLRHVQKTGFSLRWFDECLMTNYSQTVKTKKRILWKHALKHVPSSITFPCTTILWICILWWWWYGQIPLPGQGPILITFPFPSAKNGKLKNGSLCNMIQYYPVLIFWCIYIYGFTWPVGECALKFTMSKLSPLPLKVCDVWGELLLIWIKWFLDLIFFYHFIGVGEQHCYKLPFSIEYIKHKHVHSGIMLFSYLKVRDLIISWYGHTIPRKR